MIIGTYDIDFYKEALIIPSNNKDYDRLINSIENMANKVYDEIMKTSNISVSFSGSVVEDILKIHVAYYEARVALNYRQPVSNFKVLWYKKYLGKSDSFFVYTIEMESKLIDCIISGRSKDCKALISNLYNLNFEQNRLSYNMSIQLLNSIISTIYRISERLPDYRDRISAKLQEFTDDISKNPDISVEFKKIEKFLVEFCKEIDSFKNKESTSLINRVMDYINNNFSDCQISLASVADEFGITEVYLSRLFKKQTGENFSKYIEKLRMEKAQELLAKKYRVSHIVEQVGYNSPQVFRRVYKRYYGKSPTEYNKNDESEE